MHQQRDGWGSGGGGGGGVEEGGVELGRGEWRQKLSSPPGKQRGSLQQGDYY